MRKTALLFLIACATLAHAQNGRYDSVALGPKGAIPNATVAVCKQPANTGTAPCSPLAGFGSGGKLCASTTDIVCNSPNPFTADGLGNYHFYAPQSGGPYTVQLYGPQVAAPTAFADQGTAAIPGASFAASSLNSILYVDGVRFTTIDQAIASVSSFNIVASTGCTESTNVATCTTTVAHNFLVGQTVFVTGVAVNGYNGTFTITAVTSTTFSYFDCVGQNPSSPTFCTTGLGSSGGGTVAPLATVVIPNTYLGADVATCTSLDPAGNAIGYFYSVTPPNITVVDYRSGATCAYNVAWNGNSLASNPNNLTLWRRDTSPTTTTSNLVTDLQVTGSYPQNGAVAGGTFEVDTIGNLSPPANGIIQATNGQFAVRSKGGTIFQIMGTSGGGGIDRSYDTTNIIQASGMYAFYPTNASTSGATITDAYGMTATYTAGIGTRNNEAIYSQGPLLFLDQSGIDIQNAAGAVGPTAQPIMRFGGVCGSAGTCGVSVFTPNSAVGPMIKFIPQGSTHTNWEISDQNNIGNGFEITPSTAAGGTTFSNPAVVVLQNTNGGTLEIFGSTSGNSSLNAPATAGVTNTLPSTAGTLGVIVANGTAALTTAAITAGNCGTTVTVAAANVATTDTITWAFNAAPAGTNAGVVAWPTSGNVNFAYCPGVAETPAAATVNWKVVR